MKRLHLLPRALAGAGLLCLLAAAHAAPATPATSQLLRQNADGAWSFPTLTVGGKTWNLGAYDFSYAGYEYGEHEDFAGIPPATRTLSADDGEDITDRLNAAIAALPSGGTVLIPAGTFRIGAGRTGDAVVIATDNLVIKGTGKGVTTLVVDPTYHSAPDASARQTATFGTGVITFGKPGPFPWHYSTHPVTTATKAVPLGAREITVADASSFAVGDTLVIRQLMGEAFVRKNAFDPSKGARALRWTNYDSAGKPRFSEPGYSFAFLRRVLAKHGDTLTLDVPIPRDLDPADMPVTVGPVRVPLLRNCGLADLTLTAPPEEGAAPEHSIGTTLMIKGLVNGLFKNVAIASFRTLAFATTYAVNVSFLHCDAANAINCGGGGSGYGFYIKGQNLLYKDCTATNLRHGFTTAAPQTCDIVIRGCTSTDYHFNTDLTSGECVDDTHLHYSYAILWDNHRSKDAGLLMVNRGTLSGAAYETCGWTIVWNYESAGFNTRSSTRHDLRHNLVGVTPAEFGFVIGAHSSGEGPDGIRVRDGYARYPATTWGEAITTPALQVGPVSHRVLYELTGHPVAGSLYDLMLARRPRLLPTTTR